MNRQTTFYASLVVSTLAIVLLPYPDYSGHGNYATALALIALTGTILCMVLAMVTFLRVKTASPNLEMSVYMAASPVAQILATSLLAKSLSLEDFSGITWLVCAMLSEVFAISLLIALAVRTIRKRRSRRV